MAYIDTLIEKFPIRKTKLQKECFRNWVMDECVRLGYTAQVETKGSSNNVVIGDADKAEAIFTAHYDTPAVMPVPNFITPCNVLVYILYQLVLTIALLAVSGVVAGSLGWLANSIFGDGELAFWVGYLAEMVSLFGLLGLMLFGPANKNNANDNTSGVASVLETMARIPAEKRGKVAFILFDNEEKGMLGSSAFASKHKDVKKNTLLVNMDCVGLGENILFFSPKKARGHAHYEKLVAGMNAQAGRNLEMFNMEGHLYPSDQSQFKHGIAVCSCKKAKVIGYYCDKIHTKHDTIADAGNIAFIADGLAAFAQSL
ncbi:MAG: M28 family peptidase [Clostridia bacterium]|nr:M28 family peptidase [Clostridia bacterium]MBQ7865915.1 M28 family peptidase [Clostridia bacterium]